MRNLELNPDQRTKDEAREMAAYIVGLLKGNRGIESDGSGIVLTEKLRQFFCWGVKTFYIIVATDGCVGVQFKVSGLKHRGRVRIWYNYVTDYFDVEFLRALKDVVVKEYEDIDFEQLHNVCHKFIERDDDVEV